MTKRTFVHRNGKVVETTGEPKWACREQFAFLDIHKPPHPPIPCKGLWSHTVDGSDFDCEYPHAGAFGCEDCIVNDGRYDPRTGKSYRKGK
jgi:hypothetical protein